MATRGDSAGAVEVLLEGMAASREGRPAADRLYEWLLPDLIRFGGLRESGAIIAEWDREVPVDTDPVWGQVARFEVEAEAAYARGRIPESIAAWESYEEACPTCSPAASYGLARAFEAAGERDRAIAEYERSLEPGNQYDVDPFFRSDVLRRLARLHEEAGNREQAASYYERIVDRWSEADPGLQPQVEAARARLAGLR